MNVLQQLGQKVASLFGDPYSFVEQKTNEQETAEVFSKDAIAKILPWITYDETSGLFYGKSSLGFVIEAIPILGSSETIQKEVSAIFQELLEEGDSIQCLLWADHRVDPFLGQWEKECIKDQEIYAEISRKRTEFLKNSPNFPPRFFRFILSYSTPSIKQSDNVIVEKFKQKKERILKSLKSLTYAFSWDVKYFLENVGALINFNLETEPKKKKWNIYQTLASQLTTSGFIRVNEDNLEWKTNTEILFKSYRAIDFPDEWSLNAMQFLIGDLFRDAFRIQDPFFIHYGVHCPKQSKAGSQFWKKSHLIEKQGRSHTLLRFIPDLERELKECDFVRRSLNQEERFVYTQLSVGLWAKKERFSNSEQSLKSLFRTNQFTLSENRFLQLPSFLSSLPMTWGEYAKELKELNLLKTTMTSECANFVPFLGEWSGTPSPGMLLMGRRGQLMNWNPFDNKTGNYNIVVIGRSGAGKSVFMQDLLLSGLRTGAKVFVLEVGRSFEKLFDLLQGQSINFSKNSTLCLNPFTRVSLEDEEERETSFSFIKSVISCMAAPSQGTTDFESSLIEKAIHEVWKIKKNEATITDIAEWLCSQEDSRAKTIGIMLTPYSKGGTHARYFEGKSNVDLTSRMVLVELEELKEKKDLQSVVLQLFIIAITNQAFLGDRKTPFFICIDEAWELLKGKQTVGFIETLARRLRKYNGSLVIGTQNVDDFFSAPGALAAYENSDWTCLLPLKHESIKRLSENGKLSMSEAKNFALESVTTIHGEYGEVMICDADGHYSIQRLVLDPFSQLLYSTKPDEYASVKELQKQGLTVSQAIYRLLKEKN